MRTHTPYMHTQTHIQGGVSSRYSGKSLSLLDNVTGLHHPNTNVEEMCDTKLKTHKHTHTPAAGALPLVWKGLGAISGATAAATKGFVDGTAE